MTIFGFQVTESAFAVEQKGTEDKEIQVARSWYERFFDPDPTRPLWQKTKPVIIQVPHYEPAIIQMGNKFLVHPSLMPKLKEAMTKPSSLEF